MPLILFWAEVVEEEEEDDDKNSIFLGLLKIEVSFYSSSSDSIFISPEKRDSSSSSIFISAGKTEFSSSSSSSTSARNKIKDILVVAEKVLGFNR